ncbi:MAG: deoxyribose-phosphate aldolase [Miniphocaeibacter sp.]|uniref:deoxyribose-phosphate aldolase n=1 Tax=Miniphocaeibacter sp. TaxID=3100973 RepID=UPI0017BD6DA0|nr:deoxyribose-phosphate aldolase [Gallicola sp.]
MEINKYIDHTLLKPDATIEQIKKLCYEAKEYDFKSVCVNGYYARTVTELLQGSDVRTCVVVGFPLGASISEIKALEAERAIEDGASEIDMVINISALKNKDYDYVQRDIEKVLEATDDAAILKVIIETGLLTEEEKIKACEIALKSGADFVKTSTGFGNGGATVEDVALMKKVVGNKAEVKASGGIRTKEDALKMIEAGATRIGASNGVKIVSD